MKCKCPDCEMTILACGEWCSVCYRECRGGVLRRVVRRILKWMLEKI